MFPALDTARARCLAGAFILILAACGEGSDVDTSTRQQTSPLPAPVVRGEMSLEETLATRQSVREFTDEPLTDAEISQLLWAAQGITRGGRGRTSPSAGGLYPLELYLVTAEGVSHYRPDGHALDSLTLQDLRVPLHHVALGQEAVRDAPAVFVVTAVFERTAVKYLGRAERYVHLEAGHAAHGLLLQAVALDLGGVPIGAFADDRVQQVLGLPDDHEPLYLIPVGHPAP